MELRVDPPDGLVDEPPRIEVLGTTAGRQVDFQLSVTDAAGHRWRSRGQDTDRLFWNMEFASEDVAPTAFVAAVDQLDYRLEARCGDETAASRVTRRWSAPGVERRELHGEGFAGALFTLRWSRWPRFSPPTAT